MSDLWDIVEETPGGHGTVIDTTLESGLTLYDAEARLCRLLGMDHEVWLVPHVGDGDGGEPVDVGNTSLSLDTMDFLQS